MIEKKALKVVAIAACATLAFGGITASSALAAELTLREGATTSMNVGDTARTDTLYFRYGANVKVSWESSNTSVASLGYESIGMSMISTPFGSGTYETHSMSVRANRPGTATITATTAAGVQGTYTVVVNKLKEPVPVPGPNSFTYSGSQITFMSSGSHYTVSGGSATAAGSYTATASLTDTGMYEWADGTTAPKTFAWSIAKHEVAVPDAASDLVYDGSEQTGVEGSELYELDGTYIASDAGKYIATAALIDSSNYKWSDGSSDEKTIEWSIAKAKNGMKAKLKKASFKQSLTKRQTTSISVSKASGTLTYKCSTKKVQVSKGGKITIAKGYKGTARIQVVAAGDANHLALKQTLTLKVR